jgi:hypothetical protein
LREIFQNKPHRAARLSRSVHVSKLRTLLELTLPDHITIRVTQSGEVAVSGLSRFPVTLHKEQWNRLLNMSGEIRQFIAAHEGELLPEY